MVKRTNIGIYATPEELALLNSLKKHYLRRTLADTLRYLIVSEGQKILPRNTQIGINESVFTPKYPVQK